MNLYERLDGLYPKRNVARTLLGELLTQAPPRPTTWRMWPEQEVRALPSAGAPV